MNAQHTPGIIEAADKWTKASDNLNFRIWKGRIWRQELNPAFYGGNQIKHISLDTKLGKEWVAEAYALLASLEGSAT